MPISDDREYRDINLAEIETREADDGTMVVEGYATTFNQPYLLYTDDKYDIYEEVTDHAFDDTDMRDVIMQYNHEGRVFARNKNGTLTLTPDEHGLKITADLSGTDIGRQLYQEIKGGYTDKMSFGFVVDRSKDTRTETPIDNGRVRIKRSINAIKKLYDVSAVSIPANDATAISARNVSNGLIGEIEQELLAIKARERKKKQILLMMEMSK